MILVKYSNEKATPFNLPLSIGFHPRQRPDTHDIRQGGKGCRRHTITLLNVDREQPIRVRLYGGQ
jgi:hypothetical protein